MRESRDRVRASLKKLRLRLPGQPDHGESGACGCAQGGVSVRSASAPALLKASGQLTAGLEDSAFGGTVPHRGDPAGEGRAYGDRCPGRRALPRLYPRRRMPPKGAVVEGSRSIPAAQFPSCWSIWRGGRRYPVRFQIRRGRSGRCPDFADVMGQAAARRALEVAAAGSHNILLIGPPGSGKEHAGQAPAHHLAGDDAGKRRWRLLKIHSVAGVLPGGTGLLRSRPFRAPLDISAPDWREAEASHARRCHWPITACCSWTNCRSFPASPWKRCASRLRTGK